LIIFLILLLKRYSVFPKILYLLDKNPPLVADNLGLILNISIPLSCVFIMFCFVSFLCFKSHKELKEIQDDDLDGKPFELIQAAMILPIKKAPDLLTSSGKNLWKNALEKLKQEQIKNNPLNHPSTFLTRGSLSDLVDEIRSNGGGHKPVSSRQAEPDNGSFASIVTSLINKRRDTRIEGTLGLPIISNQNIPKISINPCLDDEDNNINNNSEVRITDENLNLNQIDTLDRIPDDSIASLSPSLSMHSIDALVTGQLPPMKRQDFNEDGDQLKLKPTNKRNMVEVVVDLNNTRKSNKTQNKLIPNNSKQNDLDSLSLKRGSVISNSNCAQYEDANDNLPNEILSKSEFRDSIRRESIRRKSEYFPNSPDKKLPPTTPMPTYQAAKPNNIAADYSIVTFV